MTLVSSLVDVTTSGSPYTPLTVEETGPLSLMDQLVVTCMLMSLFAVMLMEPSEDVMDPASEELVRNITY